MTDLKGISKRIVEISQPNHEYIERIIVILKPDSPNVKLSTQQSEAEKYVSNLVCWKRSFIPKGAKGWFLALGLTVAFAAIFSGVFLF